MQRIVLAYSGGLNSSVAIPWLNERHGAEIVAVTIDLGQGRDLEAVRERALDAGAVRAHVLDHREEFARDYLLPALKSEAIAEPGRPIAASLGAALVAEKLVEIAEIERATAVAHGGTGSRPDQMCLDETTRALNPALTVLDPAREWRMTRSEAVVYARQHGISVPTSFDPRRVETNVWGQSIEHRGNDSAQLYRLTESPADCPDEAADVEIAFSCGVPVTVNGVAMPLLDLIGSLDTIAGFDGVPRTAADHCRQMAEAPAAVVLHAAHHALQQLVTPEDLDRFFRVVSREYADLICSGRWFTPLRRALDALVESVQERVTGTVRVKLFKGAFTVVDKVASPPPARMIGLPAERSPRQALPARRRKLSVAR